MGYAPDSVKRLVDLSACNAQADRFHQDRKVFVSPDYKEEQLRLEFLNPFFSALGWDMDNEQGLSDLSACNAQAETFKQVIHEESINACPERSRRVAGASKAPDYTFRIGGRRPQKPSLITLTSMLTSC
jgi:hypothetical protein